MRFFATSLALALPLLASAAPLKRQADNTTILVLQFADVLEQLESQFYTEALAKFQASDFTAAGFATAQIPMQQFTNIASDESTHSTVLQAEIANLGAKPVTSCKFDFSSVLTDVTTMAGAARLVENTGVAAYAGAAHLISDPRLLTAAASILTVEARHQTVLNILSSGTAIPQAFDIPLVPQEVLAIAGGFISGCDVGVTALPSLALTNTGTVGAGTSLTFSSTAINSTTDGFFCQMMAGGLPFSIALPFNQCVVPAGITGPVALWVTSDGNPLVNNPVDRAMNKIVAGPTMLFLDNQQDALGTMVRSSVGGGSGSSSPAASGSSPNSTSTSTITPDQASSIISGASPSSTGSPSASGGSTSGSGTPEDVLTPGTANFYTGPSPDGHMLVNGWTNVTASAVGGSSVPSPGGSSTMVVLPSSSSSA